MFLVIGIVFRAMTHHQMCVVQQNMRVLLSSASMQWRLTTTACGSLIRYFVSHIFSVFYIFCLVVSVHKQKKAILLIGSMFRVVQFPSTLTTHE